MQNKKVKIVNKLGLHARAAAKFVAHASRFASEIHVCVDNKNANGKSIMGVMMLAAKIGAEIELNIHGDDELQALEALEELVNQRFGEAE